MARIVAALIQTAIVATGLRRHRSSSCPIPLFGGKADWQVSAWSEYSDRVSRGGKSYGFLANASAGSAVIQGVLDPSVLGAGFAGAQVPGSAFPQLSGLSGIGSGILLDIADGDGQPYKISFSMEGSRGGDAHRFSFTGEAGLLRLYLADFEEDCRGTPCPGRIGPLDLDRVSKMNIAITALSPTENAGPFSLLLRSIEGFTADCNRASIGA